MNQDALLAEPPLFVVADGMGGHAAGEVASQLTLATLHEALQGDGEPSRAKVEHAIEAANGTVLQRSNDEIELRGMGTTLTGVVLVRDGDEQQLMVFNVGDSRTYLLHGGRLEQVTRDHSYVEELVQLGELTPEQARVHPHRNVVTRAIGIEPAIVPDVWERALTIGDRYLICSDGLVNEVDDPTIAEILRATPDPQRAADELLTLANDFGGRDNIAIIVVDVVEAAESLVSDGGQTVAAPAESVPATVAEPAVGGWLHDDGHEFDHPEASASVAVAALEPAPAPAPTARRRRLVTARTVVFFLALMIVFVVAFGSIAVYARSGYHVGFSNDQVALYQGRQVLWFDPTVEVLYPLYRDDLTEEWQHRLDDGVPVDSRAEADEFFLKLSTDPGAVPALTSTTSTLETTTTTTTAPETTVPTSPPPSGP